MANIASGLVSNLGYSVPAATAAEGVFAIGLGLMTAPPSITATEVRHKYGGTNVTYRLHGGNHGKSGVYQQQAGAWLDTLGGTVVYSAARALMVAANSAPENPNNAEIAGEAAKSFF